METALHSALRFPQVIDNTIRREWGICRHRCFRRHFQGLALKAAATKSVHLIFGGAFAKGLEVTRKEYFEHGNSANDALIRGCIAALTELGNYEFEPRTKSEELKSPAALLDALSSYFEHYSLNSDAVRPLDLGYGPLIERSFAVPIPGSRHPDTGEPIIYAGRCDMVGTIENGVWIVDEKTSSRLGDSWTEKWDLDGQPTGYVWGFRSFGINPIGAIMRGIGIYTKNIVFIESIQPRPTWKVEQWFRQLTYDVDEMCRAYIHYKDIVDSSYDPEGRAFGRALSDACHSYNRPCTYKSICDTSDPSRWLDDYIIDFWDPLHVQDPSSNEN